MLGTPEQLLVEDRRLTQFGTELIDLGDFFDEPRVDTGHLGHLLNRHARGQRALDAVEPAIARHPQFLQEGVQVLDGLSLVGPEARRRGLQRAHDLAERLGEVAAEGHRLSHRFHGGGQGGVGAGNFSKANQGALTTT